MQEKEFSTEWLGRTLTIKHGKLAQHADASVLVQYGDTVVMATVVESKIEREGMDFFPLMVDFEEKLYAAGIIKGSQWVKREGRPSDDTVLTGRMIDRSIRPLFDESSRKDIQVIITPLSVDQENDHDILSLIAASAALSISGIDWKGPVGGVRVGLINDKFVFNPTYEERDESSLDLIVVGTEKKIIMVECGAKEVSEDKMYEAIIEGQKQLQVANELIQKLKKEVPVVEKSPVQQLITEEEKEKEVKKEETVKIAQEWLDKNIKGILFDKSYLTKRERKAGVLAIKEQLSQVLFDQGIDKDLIAHAVKSLVGSMVDAEITEAIVDRKERIDGRKLNEIRKLTSDIGFLPRTHGSGLFSRGETQVMSLVTLGASSLEQTLEGIEGKSTKRYMHHYNFPPFSVGETRPLRGTGRREIGHGSLAEKALEPVIPAKEDFPYTIRVVSETLGSNGSSSMASTCGSTLALMDAGVPIKRPVVGIAIGLASNDDMSKWEVLTDIQDLEDGKGGMDFKVTGTSEGITAIQLDTKTDGLTNEIIKQALTQGREALNEILESLQAVIKEPKKELSEYAPRIISFNIDVDDIGSVIGPGGKNIKAILEETGVEIDIEDSGLVMVCGTDAENCQKAVDIIKEMTKKFEAGEILTGKVVRALDFGVFISLNQKQDGMVHISELAPYRVNKVEDIVKVGDEVTVKIKEIDDQGRINLTMKGLDANKKYWSEPAPSSSNGSRPRTFNNGGGDRPNGNRFNNDRKFNNNNRRPNNPSNTPRPPHHNNPKPVTPVVEEKKEKKGFMSRFTGKKTK